MRSLWFKVLCVCASSVLVASCGLWSSSRDAGPPSVSQKSENSGSARRTGKRAKDSRRTAGQTQRYPWLGMSENACMASGLAGRSRFIAARSSLGGPLRGCGASRPLRVAALDHGRISFSNTATVRCPMVPALETWSRDVMMPAATRYLGSPVTRLRVVASYACRTRNSRPGAKLSEHGRANAIDIAGFELADGRVITLKRGWWGNRSERLFLRAVHKGACRMFSTVLGPDSDRYHHDHFHFDLARHGRDGTYMVCR
jgi:hypothetical protein